MNGEWFSDARKAVQHLNRRIEENKRQEPRRKFIEDYHLIHNRKMDEPCIPILPGHDQEAWFARLESNEIWEIVFNYVTAPSDVTSAYFACEMFRKHLEKKRKMMMLPKVFGVLQDTGDLEFSEVGRREVLNQRLVSKTWKKAAEEKFLVHRKFSEPIQNLEIDDWDWGNVTACHFEIVDDVNKAVNKLRNPKTCESLLRMVIVKVNDVYHPLRDEALFFSKLVSFFDLHGESVWALKYKQRGPSTFKYNEVRDMVSRMPNLKALYLDYHWTDWGYEGDEDVVSARPEFQEGKARLQSSIVRNPFPNLASLESLSMYFYPAQNEFLVAEILNNCENLKAVRLGEWDWYDGDNVIPLFVWNALRNLQLEHFDFIYYDVRGHLFMRDFCKLREFNWPLKYLRVRYSNETNGVENVFDIGASNIFKVLSQFNDTLEHFTLDGMINVRLVNDRKGVVVDFPKLKEFDFPRIILKKRIRIN